MTVNDERGCVSPTVLANVTCPLNRTGNLGGRSGESRNCDLLLASCRLLASVCEVKTLMDVICGTAEAESSFRASAR
jgi:hypothetical protein